MLDAQEVLRWILQHAQDNGLGTADGTAFEPTPGREVDAMKFISWWLGLTETAFAEIDEQGFGIHHGGLQLDVMPGCEDAAIAQLNDFVARVIRGHQLIAEAQQ